jgi:hypothetical protein
MRRLISSSALISRQIMQSPSSSVYRYIMERTDSQGSNLGSRYLKLYERLVVQTGRTRRRGIEWLLSRQSVSEDLDLELGRKFVSTINKVWAENLLRRDHEFV